MIRVKLKNKGMEALTPTQRYLLVVLVTFANTEGECWPSQKLLADMVGTSQPTISAGLKKLEEEGFIESCYRTNQKGGNISKLYRMLFEPFVFKQIKEDHYNCFGQRIDDPRITDTSWAENLE
ncbi:helix-turn-helix domain-containing protein [Endozoicomonas sp. ALE010]